MGECQVRSFRARWSNWKTSWWRSSTIQLPVTFRLELEQGSSKASCIVGQLKRGRSEIGGSAGGDIWQDWEGDSEWGSGWWWDGEKFANAGDGEWETVGCSRGAERVATFKDAPGFYEAPKGQSLYMGAAVGNAGYFDFKTFVKDKTSGKTLAEINWSMRINIPVPGKGGSWWSFSDQK